MKVQIIGIKNNYLKISSQSHTIFTQESSYCFRAS